MYDLKFVRTHSEVLREAIRKKGESADLDKVLALDERRRALLVEVETLKAERNARSQEIGKAKTTGADAAEAIAAMRAVAQRIKDLDAELSANQQEIDEHLQWVPNISRPRLA